MPPRLKTINGTFTEQVIWPLKRFKLQAGVKKCHFVNFSRFFKNYYSLDMACRSTHKLLLCTIFTLSPLCTQNLSNYCRRKIDRVNFTINFYFSDMACRSTHKLLLCAIFTPSSLCSFCGTLLEYFPCLESQLRHVNRKRNLVILSETLLVRVRWVVDFLARFDCKMNVECTKCQLISRTFLGLQIYQKNKEVKSKK